MIRIFTLFKIQRTIIKVVIPLFLYLAFNTNTKASQPFFANEKKPLKLLVVNDTLKIKALTDSCWKYRSNAPQKALEFGLTALNLTKSTGIEKYKARILSFLGVVYRNIGDLKNALKYYYKALEVSKILKDSVELGYSYENLGDYYYKRASYSISLENVLSAYLIFEKTNNQTGQAYTLNNLCEIYLKQQDFNKALSYVKRAAALRLKNKDLRGYAKSLLTMANVYEEMKKTDKAIAVYEKALTISKKIGYLKGISSIYAGLSEIYFDLGNYKEAFSKSNKSLKIDKKISNKYGVIKNLNRLGKIYLNLHNYTKAKLYFLKAGKSARESGHTAQEMESYYNIANLFSSKSDFKNAYEYYNKYMVLKNSIFSQESMGKIADLQTTFAIAKKDLENSILKKNVEHQKAIWELMLVIFLITLLLIILLISKYRSKQKTNKLLTELNGSKDKFFSIIAHDLKNPFVGLLGYTEMLYKDFDSLTQEDIKNSVESLYNVSHNVFDLLEGLLDWSRAQTGRIELNPTLFKLSEETGNVINLFAGNAEKKGIKLVDKTDIGISVFADRKMINTILRNLVANAIKFTDQDGIVKIFAIEEESKVIVTVEDTGIGMNKNEIENLFRIDIHHTTLGTNNEVGTGVGLMLCDELIKLNHGKIWAESELGKGSKFKFTLSKKKI